METSQKAKLSVEKNIDRPRVGRMGFVGLQKFEKDRWKQLVERYPHLQKTEDEIVQRYAVSRAFYNSVIGSYELPEHLLSDGGLEGTLQDLTCKELEMKKDGVIKTKRSRKKKRKYEVAQAVREDIDAIQRHKSCVATSAQASSAVSLPEIKSISSCDLLWPFDESFPDKALGRGQVYPTSERILDKRPIHVGFVKVYVDYVSEDCKGFLILPATMIGDEITNMGSTHRKFIQWPRKAIKLIMKESPQQSNQHQQLSQQSESYKPASYDEEQITSQEDLNSSTKFMDLLNTSCLIQPTHLEHFLDPALNASEAFTTPTTTKLVTNPGRAFKASEAKLAPKSSKHVIDPKVTDDVHDPNVFRIAAILKKAKSKPKKICSFAEQLASYSKQSISIKVTSSTGMFKGDLTEDVELEEIMTFYVNGLLEVSVLHWYTM
ncbi:hypothetical protein M8C21_030334 [Ambrosia artemisiifolia]|uniref:DUF8039 domain-containing protein n=1 Tax=Ambrosia artemisiifolia TaxID=4212 RepID=A0AAD5CJE7_AMBAR|nr:hypothetical protein M8C21_030334 [Ambrosia artemisiifolia]